MNTGFDSQTLHKENERRTFFDIVDTGNVTRINIKR